MSADVIPKQKIEQYQYLPAKSTKFILLIVSVGLSSLRVACLQNKLHFIYLFIYFNLTKKNKEMQLIVNFLFRHSYWYKNFLPM